MSASKHWERRIPIYLIGMFLMTIGVNLSVLSGIGVSPIDTLPYIVSLIAQKSLGLCTTLVFSVYILLQIVILRRRFQWKNLLQIVLSIIFGWFVSLSGALTALLPQHPSYPIQFIYMLCSIIFLGSGSDRSSSEDNSSGQSGSQNGGSTNPYGSYGYGYTIP